MPYPPTPERLLFIRPDTYGDIVLFEPALRLVREAWPQTQVAVLIREPYADLAPLLTPGVRWLTTSCNPYRLDSCDCRKELDRLREMIQAFAPDWLVAPCFAQTWLEFAVASFVPDARQIRMGGPAPDGASTALFAEAVAVEEASLDWEKNLRLASFLVGREAERLSPRVSIPADAQAGAQAILDRESLVRGEFIACAATGTANVAIKAWPASAYGETLAWLEREHGRRALLVGHANERERLESAAEAARAGGAHPALWLGEDGSIALLGGLLEACGAYFGNDTGALHLAAALGRPVAAIYGGGTWPRFQPVGARAVAVVQPLPCFGCGWDCYFGDAPCLRTIGVDPVRKALDLLLRDETATQLRVAETQDLDAGAREMIAAATPRLRFQKADGADRLRQVHELSDKLVFFEDTAGARLTQVTELTALLKATQADANARLTQVAELTALLNTAETDAAARLAQVTKLTALLQAARADADERMAQITSLTALVAEIRGHADARMVQIEQLTAWLRESEQAAGETAADLRSRLELSRGQELALRAETRRLGDESRLLRRLAAFSLAAEDARAQTPYRESGPASAVIEPGAAFSLETPEVRDDLAVFRGWAFLPVPAWDCLHASISLLFREGEQTFAAPAAGATRPELPAHFAALPAEASGGARELAAAGFECRVALASLPAGRKLAISIRLKSAHICHDQPTGQTFLKKGSRSLRRAWRNLLKS